MIAVTPAAPPARWGFSPLDEELQLLPGSLTPSLVESVVRLATWMPFRPAAAMLRHFRGTDVSEATVRRDTENAGQAYVEVQEAEVERLEKGGVAAVEGPALQLVSVDGAFVPLKGKAQWGEVKTLAIGVVSKPELNKEGELVVHTKELSYFSRLAEHEVFSWQATVETHRRGTETAGTVCAAMDGAEWEQKFVDLHRPDAVRILDFGHSSGYVAKVGQAVFGAGTAEAQQWVEVQLQELRHGDPQKVLGKLRGLRDELAAEEKGEESETLKVVKGSLEYLEKRQEQIRYAEFEAKGYPIGSGAVESANKLVVEARLKGAGMHWGREHVNGMVALRNIACSDRWEEAWVQISEELRKEAQERRSARRAEGERAAVAARIAAIEVEEAPAAVVRVGVDGVMEASAKASSQQGIRAGDTVEAKANAGTKRPAANHPWRWMPIGRAVQRRAR